MKPAIAIFASAFLATASITAPGARAQTNETPAPQSEQPAPDKKDDKAEGHGQHQGDCCKTMHEMHDKMMHDMKPMHGMQGHDMQGHDSKDGGGEHGCCGHMQHGQ